MRKIIILVCIVFCFGFIAKKIDKVKNQKDFEVIYKTKSLKLNGYKFVVASSIINDSLKENSYFYSCPLFLKQTIKIYKKNKLILKRNHISKRIDVTSYHGKKLNVIENRITEIGIIDTEKGVLFYINGWGGCDDCSTYLEVIDNYGKTIYLDYSDKYNVFKSKGDYRNFLKKYKVSNEKFRTGNFLKTKI